MTDNDNIREKELIDYYVEDLEQKAAELEVTVDYYIAEFTWWLNYLIAQHVIHCGMKHQSQSNFITTILHHTSIPVWLRCKRGKQIAPMLTSAQIVKPYSIWTAPLKTLINEDLTWHGLYSMIFS